MESELMFIDCPEYLNRSGTARCGLPAEVEDLYRLPSTDGPLDSVRIRCPRGHWFNGPLDAMALDEAIQDDRIRTTGLERCAGVWGRYRADGPAVTSRWPARPVMPRAQG